MSVLECIKVLEDILEHVEPGDPPEEHYAIALSIAIIRSLPETMISLIDSLCALAPDAFKKH